MTETISPEARHTLTALTYTELAEQLAGVSVFCTEAWALRAPQVAATVALTEQVTRVADTLDRILDRLERM